MLFLQGLPFCIHFHNFLQVHFACALCFNFISTDSFDDRRFQCRWSNDVTRVAIWSTPGRAHHTSWIRECAVDHFKHLHSSSQLLHQSIVNIKSFDDTGHPYSLWFQRAPSVMVLKINRYKRNNNGRLSHRIWLWYRQMGQSQTRSAKRRTKFDRCPISNNFPHLLMFPADPVNP